MMDLPRVYWDMLYYHVCCLYALLCNELVPCFYHMTGIVPLIVMRLNTLESESNASSSDKKRSWEAMGIMGIGYEGLVIVVVFLM